jgi:DNA-binding response OmpR family regulator
VALGEPSEGQAGGDSTRWLSPDTTPYALMMAVVRSHLAPAIDYPPSILVLDDDRVTLAVIKRTLQQVDFHVEAINSPFEFWDAMEQRRPDLIVLDIDLPTLSGIEICRALRLDDRYCTLPVLFISSYMDSRTVQRAYEAGADDFMYKPIVPRELGVRVSNRLERCRQRVTHRQAAIASQRTYTSLDQLLLRALRENVPLAVALIETPEPKELAYTLRSGLRAEDVIRPLSANELLVAMLTHEQHIAESRLRRLLQPSAAGLKLGLATFSEETSYASVLEQARAALAPL